MSKFKIGDKVVLNRNFGGVTKDSIFTVVETTGERQWLNAEFQVVELEYISKKPHSELFDLVEGKAQEKEPKKIIKTLPSWFKEEYYEHYVDIVNHFIKEHAKDHDISVIDGNETVMTATPRKQGN